MNLPEIDAPSICLIEGKHECRTGRLNEEIALNIGGGEQLVGIEIGQYSIRINNQWRIGFEWIGQDAYNVESVDYH